MARKKSARLTSKAVKIRVTMTTGYWQRLSGFGEEGGGRSRLGISPEFWEMPFLPSELLAVTETSTGTSSDWEGKGSREGSSKG